MYSTTSFKLSFFNLQHLRLFLLFSLVLSCGHIPSTSEETESPIVGTWKLVEFSNLDKETGEWTYRYGKNPKGYFTYTASNIVNLNISDEIPLVLDADSSLIRKFTHFDLLLSSVGYFGSYTIDYESSTVTHHVEGGSIPYYIGTKQDRPFVLKGDTLKITDGKTYNRVLVKVD